MRGVVLGSIVLLAVACVPAKKPPELAPNDPNYVEPGSTPGSTKAENSSETWGSSETAASNKATTGTSTESTDTADKGDKGGTSKGSVDDNAHVPASLGGPTYDRTTLEVTLKRAARQVKSNCGSATDDNGTVTGPWGKTTVTVKLGHNGHSKGGTAAAPFDGKPTGSCAVKAFTNLIYAPFAGSDTDVDWPVEIVKP
jgi:hypothetical protein